MNNTRKSNRITRLEFLKNSGLLAAGITLSSRFRVVRIPGDEKYNNNDIAAKISGYQIVVPSRADAVEKQAAQQLQQYVSKMAGSEIAVVGENEFKGKKAIYIGNTDYAKKQQS